MAGTQRTEKEEPYRPMAVKEPNYSDRIEALEIRMAALEQVVEKHQRHHFGKT